MKGLAVAMVHLMGWKQLVAGLGLLLAQVVLAGPVSSDLAKVAVNTWLGRQAQLGAQLGTRVLSVWSCQTNGASFHVVRIEDGGFVVTSTDTETEPIIAFSESPDLVVSEKNPLWTLLTRDLAARPKKVLKAAAQVGLKSLVISPAAAKWDSLTSGAVTSANGLLRSVQMATGQESVSDLRVAPLLETLWGQQQDSRYSNLGSPCYNYYTPNNYPCGCVATAGGQIMRYHCYPTGSVTPMTRTCAVETGKDWVDAYSYYPVYSKCSYTMQGGIYDWANMPLDPDDGTTLEQRQAIGKLTSDIGIACYMTYGENSSGAGGYLLAPAFTQIFGYANALPLQYSGNCSASTWQAVLLPNIDARLPVAVSLDGPSGGHAVVADGYGYSLSTLYVHFNMGWSGKGNAWYAPPAVEDFTAIDGFVCNVYPGGAARGVICSGRVLSSTGEPIPGAMVSAGGSTGARSSCLTDEKGIYALILAAGSYTLTATKGTMTANKSVTLTANVATQVSGSGYYPSPAPQVNNKFGQDFFLGAESTPPGGDVVYDPPPARGATYNGVFLNGNEEVAGMFSLVVKTPKKGTTVGEGTMTLVDAETGKKIKYIGGVDFIRGIGTANATGKNDFAGLHIGSKEMYGEFLSGTVRGGLDAAKAKLTDLQTAMGRLNKRTYGVSFRGPANEVASFAIVVSAKGKCKITGTMPDGSKVTASAQMFAYDGVGSVPVVYSKKSVRVAFLLRFDFEKQVIDDVSGLSGLGGEWSVEYGPADAITSGAYAVRMDRGDVGRCVPNCIVETPFEIEATFNGKKFDAGKAAKVSFKKGKLSGAVGNVSGCTLSCSKGSVKGSLTIYSLANGKLVKNKFTLAGVVVGDSAVCTATNKKLGSFPVRIMRR